MTSVYNQQETPEKNLDPDLRLQLQPPYFSRKYGVEQLIYSSGNQTSVRYEMEVRYVKTVLPDTRIFKVERLGEVYINDMLPDSLVNELAAACGKVYYPLLLEVDFTGQFTGIYNHGEIQQRWKTVQAEAGKYFQGEQAERYLNLMDHTISSLRRTTESIRNDLFISTYFSSIYKFYGPDFICSESCYFPVGNTPEVLCFATTKKLIPVRNAYKDIELEHSGYTAPTEIVPEAQYSATYTLDAATRSVEAIVAVWEVNAPVNRKMELRVFRTDQEGKGVPPAAAVSGNTSQVFIDGADQEPENSMISLFKGLFKK